MATVHLVIALALVAAGWLVVVRVLAWSSARSDGAGVPDPRTARPLLPRDNRPRRAFPVPCGPMNSVSTVAVGRRKDLV